MDEMFLQQMPEVQHETVIVDTMHPLGHLERVSSVLTVLGGDNRFSEFSAADVALSWIGDRIWSYDLVHLATAAFHTLYVGYLERFDMRMLRAIVGKPACLGHIDCYNESIRLLSYHSQHWLRTSFLFLPPAELKALASLVSFSDRSRIFSGNPEQPFRPDAPLSENYRRYIYDWLTGGDIGQGVTWHSGFTLTRETLPEFERKALAILNEHLLAIRLRALGCRVVDTTWLWTQLSRGEENDVNWTLGWREQLATRAVDALIVRGTPGQTAASSASAGAENPVS